MHTRRFQKGANQTQPVPGTTKSPKNFCPPSIDIRQLSAGGPGGLLLSSSSFLFLPCFIYVVRSTMGPCCILHMFHMVFHVWIFKCSNGIGSLFY